MQNSDRTNGNKCSEYNMPEGYRGNITATDLEFQVNGGREYPAKIVFPVKHKAIPLGPHIGLSDFNLSIS